jgi:dolichol-phosphate mannosyltransferase
MFNIWVVIPTYNESANIKILIERLFAICPEIKILVVDDNSPDQTASLVEGLIKKYSNLYLLRRAGKLGLGSAYREGFKYSLTRGAEVVGEMDADFSHKPEDLPKLLSAIEAGAEVAIGSRKVKGGQVVGWGWGRKLMSWGAMTTARVVLGLKTKDVTAGFRLYTQKALGRIFWEQVKSDGYAWQEEMIYLCEQANLKIQEVPVIFEDRKFGSSKLGPKQILEFFAIIFRLKFGKKI